MNTEKVIYQDGHTGIESTVYRDKEGIERIAYTGYLRKLEKDVTVSEYLAENPGFMCLSFDEALNRIAKAEQAEFIKPWIEISLDTWTEALECLPPQKWQTVDGVEIFRMSEYMTGSITAHYARVGDRCFFANRRTTDAYQAMAKEIAALTSKAVA